MSVAEWVEMSGLHEVINQLSDFAWIALTLLGLGSIGLFWVIFKRDFANLD